MQIKFRRILLKLSGEALMGEDAYGINTGVLNFVASEIKEIIEMGVEPGLVIGAGNIFRGVCRRQQGNGPNDCRQYGNAGHRNEQSRPPGCS